MSGSRKEAVILIALGLSLALHLALMLGVRSQVMTRGAAWANRLSRPEPMRVVNAAEVPEPVRLEAVKELQALREAPAAQLASSPRVGAEEILKSAGEAPAVTAALPEAPPAPAPELAVAALKLERAATKVELPLLTVAAPTALGSAYPVLTAAKSDGVPARAVAAPAPIGDMAPPLPPTRLESGSEPKVKFVPAAEVSAQVDEQAVAEAQTAVRQLLNVAAAKELPEFVTVRLDSAVQGEWTYFRVRVEPRAELPTVPKDVVVLLDASGSIGWDRITSIRKAAKRILRSATNSGDRFNLVAFRDRYSYAFRTWQGCTQSAFEAADRWLNELAAHGRTDVFATIRSVLTLPRDPTRPLIALVVTDGDANAGVSGTEDILAKFTALNDGLVSVYMYGVKSSANRPLIDLLTHGNRGESFIFEGMRWSAGEGLEQLSERFRDPVLSDLRVVFAAGTPAEAYPTRLRNLYRGAELTFVGRVRTGVSSVAFSLQGLNGATAYEGFFRLPLTAANPDASVTAEWQRERNCNLQIRKEQ